MISWFFGISNQRLVYPVLFLVGFWLVDDVVKFFEKQAGEIAKLRQDVTELKQLIDEELERR